MTDDSKLETNDTCSENSAYSPKRRRIGSGNGKSLRLLLIILLILIFAGGIIYLLNKGLAGDGASLLQVKVAALEQKIAGLEQQLAELQGKSTTSGEDPALVQRVNVLALKVESLEKQKQPTAESKAKPSHPPKQAVSTEKKYHTVQKGETLYWISKKYGISLEELRKRNNLSVDQPVRTGQKLLVSTGR
jgi:LysM repeat protein